MSSNRVQYFIRNILQNSKLNREKFVKNKKIYNKKNTNHNLILKRKLNTNSYKLPPPNFNNNNYWLIFAGAIAIVGYI
jgi:adenine specific DNA methylase Mod